MNTKTMIIPIFVQKILTFKVNTYFDLGSDKIWLNLADYDVIIT